MNKINQQQEWISNLKKAVNAARGIITFEEEEYHEAIKLVDRWPSENISNNTRLLWCE